MAQRKGLVISEHQLEAVDSVLDKLRQVTGSVFIALISTSGQPITTSETQDTTTDTLSLASLAASSYAATQQLAQILEEKEFSLLFHEGKDSNLHISQVTDQILLIITFARSTQIGKVRLFTSRAVEVIKPIFNEPQPGDSPDIDSDYSQYAGEAIDDLFSDVEGDEDALN